MENQKLRFFKKGGTLEDWNEVLQSGLLPHQMSWVDAKEHDDILSYAESVLGKGMVMEYECHDWNGRAQGKACLRVEDWSEVGRGFLVGDHLVASDGYYEWYGQHYLMRGKGLYHLCSCDRKKCKIKLARGDGRELVHISRWRLVNPLMMYDMEYSKKRALEGIVSFIDAWSPRVPEPAGGPAAKGKVETFEDPTGIDKALEKAKKAVTENLEPEEKKEESRGERERGPRGSVGALLEKRAAERREQQLKKEEEKAKKESRGRSRSRKRRRGRKKRRASSSERRSGSGGSRSSESSRGFRQPFTRGEDELWRLSKRNPGQLLKSGMKELSRYLASRAESGGGDESWSSYKMMAYINQVVLVQHPPPAIGVRSHRELITLGTAIDMLIMGELAELGDLLMQRLKALETSLVESNWMSARHQELIPPQAASLTSESERRRAAKQEAASLKLKELMNKNRGNK